MTDLSFFSDFLINDPDHRGKWLNYFFDENMLSLPDLKKLASQFNYVFVSKDVGFVYSEDGEVYLYELI